jgi:hypothetical protein
VVVAKEMQCKTNQTLNTMASKLITTINLSEVDGVIDLLWAQNKVFGTSTLGKLFKQRIRPWLFPGWHKRLKSDLETKEEAFLYSLRDLTLK